MNDSGGFNLRRIEEEKKADQVRENQERRRQRQRQQQEVKVKNQRVWSWGAGTEGQLGTGRLRDEHCPNLLPPLTLSSATDSPICLLACGGAHVIALTTGGRVLTWGRGASGQLGHGEMANSLQPKPVKFLEEFCMAHVSAGWSHSGFVSDTGRIFTCGDGSFGQLGHGDYNSHCAPVEVSYFSSRYVKQIACGMRHSLVLLKVADSQAQVYGFGSGKRGQLGCSEKKIGTTNVPQVTLGLKDVEIMDIYANGDHSVALSADGHLYTWGRGFCGESDAYSPGQLRSSLQFSQAALGWNHALVLTDDGKVFMHGGNLHGALGDPKKMCPFKLFSGDSREAELMEVPGIDGEKVVQIAAGSEHSAFVTEEGIIKTWGWGEHGQLGLGDTGDRKLPQAVSLCHINICSEGSVSRIYCGSGFTYAIRTLGLSSQE